MTNWIAAAVAFLKLVSTLVAFAQETRTKGEGAAIALERIFADATATIAKARKARVAVDAAARAGRLRDDDGHRRD